MIRIMASRGPMPPCTGAARDTHLEVLAALDDEAPRLTDRLRDALAIRFGSRIPCRGEANGAGTCGSWQTRKEGGG